jgi:hypothetical protein
MHPLRIPAVIKLLSDLAVDIDEAVDENNPLRQVIINTHSPSVVACVTDDALLVAHAAQDAEQTRLMLRHLPGTWRDDFCRLHATRGELLAYLNPLASVLSENSNSSSTRSGAQRRVAQRPELQGLLPFGSDGS